MLGSQIVAFLIAILTLWYIFSPGRRKVVADGLDDSALEYSQLQREKEFKLEQLRQLEEALETGELTAAEHELNRNELEHEIARILARQDEVNARS